MGSTDGETTHKNGQRGNLSMFPELEKISEKLFDPIGFEAHPFHIGWYNDLVDPKFRLDYPYNTVALVVLSGPDTYEKCVLPYIKAQLSKSASYSTIDPLDESMKCILGAAKQKIESAGYQAELFHDYDLHPNRRPKVLVQTAAHVAGAVEYFHKDRLTSKIEESTWLKDSKLFGVAIHPVHGGWFAIRGVIIITNLVLQDDLALKKPGPTIPVQDEDKIAVLLEEFGLHWKTHVWRDILPRRGDQKYSEDYKRYLDTEPDKRWEFVKNNNILP